MKPLHVEDVSNIVLSVVKSKPKSFGQLYDEVLEKIDGRFYFTETLDMFSILDNLLSRNLITKIYGDSYFITSEGLNKLGESKGDKVNMTNHPIAKFEKVSFETFSKSLKGVNESIEELYNEIKIPKRATKYSAGYDFFMPYSRLLFKNQPEIVPTGIKVKIEPGWFLAITPKSGLGFKYSLELTNTIGIIDSDYYNNETTEGHIFIKLNSPVENNLVLSKGQSFAQGILLQHGFAIEDNNFKERTGGLGSTSEELK